jgi:hypothetical protein
LRRLDIFEPAMGAMQAYPASRINRIRDEVRKVTRHPTPVELLMDLVSTTRPARDRGAVRGLPQYREALADWGGARSRAGGGADRSAVVGGRDRQAVRDAHAGRGADGRRVRAIKRAHERSSTA